MTTRSHSAPRTARFPFRVGRFARRRLERLARQDAGATPGSTPGSTPGAFFEPDQLEASTPTVQALQAHANAYARREEQRFFSRVDRELTEHRILVRQLDADLAAYDEKTDDLAPAERDSIAVGRGAAFEELRRLERRIARGRRRTDELSALIHSHFTTSRLRASRYYDYSDEKLAIYWGAFRRSGTSDRLGVRAPTLRRAEWLTTTENTKLLELWQGRTDVKA